MNHPPIKEEPFSKLSQVNELWDESRHKENLFYTGPKEREEDE